MYDVFAHSNLPTLAILAIGLLKKKEERWWTNLRGRWLRILEYLALHKRILTGLKVDTNADITVENAYTVKSAWKCETAKKNWRFRRDCLWDAILHDGARFQSILAFL